MTKKVECVTGLLSGLVLPALMWVIFDAMFKSLVLFNKPAIPYLVSIAVNLLLLRYFIRNGKEYAGYGLMITTFAIALLIFKLKA